MIRNFFKTVKSWFRSFSIAPCKCENLKFIGGGGSRDAMIYRCQDCKELFFVDESLVSDDEIS